MSSPRSQELMNKNSHHEFRFTSQDGLQVARIRWQSRGPARWSATHELSRPFSPNQPNLFWPLLYGWPIRMRSPKHGRVCQCIPFPAANIQLARNCQVFAQLESAMFPTIFTKEGGTMLNERNGCQVRSNIPGLLSSISHDQSRNREALWPR
jgi:hypothetical protein